MYLNKNDQKEMIKLMIKYIEESNCGEVTNHKTNMLMDVFFSKYADHLVKGVIHMPTYKFWNYAEVDDLLQEGRMALIQSIHKNQWDPNRGNIFNFFTTVIVRSLINYTRKYNKREESDADIDVIYNNSDMKYYQDYESQFLLQDIFREIKKYFKGKIKFIKLTELLEHYYNDNFGKKFIKKHFIEYAKAYNFSPAITNTFFAFVKNLIYSKDKEIQILLDFGDDINES